MKINVIFLFLLKNQLDFTFIISMYKYWYSKKIQILNAKIKDIYLNPLKGFNMCRSYFLFAPKDRFGYISVLSINCTFDDHSNKVPIHSIYYN